MQLFEDKILPAMTAGEMPGGKACEVFESYDFGDLEEVDFGGADGVTFADGSFAVASFRFYVLPDEERDSVSVIFHVAFLKKSTVVTVDG
jgi:hypothetical protein